MSTTEPPVIETTEPQGDEGDAERFAHIVYPASAVAEAVVTGKPCQALCGKVWVPSRDPTRYRVCPTCQEVARLNGWRVPTS